MDPLQKRYVERMVERVKRMRQQLGSGSWSELKSECHQIKGSAATYGFEALTERARETEKKLLDESPDAGKAVDTLIQDMEKIISQGE